MKNKTNSIWKTARPKLDSNPQDAALISRIARRALKHAERVRLQHGLFPLGFDGLDIDMDITATHLNGCPLRLKDLLKADDFNFVHDVFGIRRHLDRETGKLRDHFLPRFARKDSEKCALRSQT